MASQETRPEVRYAIGAIVLVLAAALVMRLGNREVRFCRAVFADLVNGRQAVQPHVDWEHLKALDVDVGATYRKFPNEQEQARYRRAFIENFSAGFHRTGATPGAFTNWRLEGKQGEYRVVAADYPAKKKTLLFSIPVTGPRQLEAIQWQ